MTETNLKFTIRKDLIMIYVSYRFPLQNMFPFNKLFPFLRGGGKTRDIGKVFQILERALFIRIRKSVTEVTMSHGLICRVVRIVCQFASPKRRLHDLENYRSKIVPPL